MKKLVSYIILSLTISLLSAGCKKVGVPTERMSEGDSISLNKITQENGLNKESKQYHVGAYDITFEAIDRDGFDVESAKGDTAAHYRYYQLPDSLKKKINVSEDNHLLSIRFQDGWLRNFTPEPEVGMDDIYFYAYYTNLNAYVVSSDALEPDNIAVFNAKDGNKLYIIPPYYSPNTKIAFSFSNLHTELKDILVANLCHVNSDKKPEKVILSIKFDALEGGYLTDSYEVIWVNNEEVLLKVEAVNQDEDAYWRIRIKE